MSIMQRTLALIKDLDKENQITTLLTANRFQITHRVRMEWNEGNESETNFNIQPGHVVVVLALLGPGEDELQKVSNQFGWDIAVPNGQAHIGYFFPAVELTEMPTDEKVRQYLNTFLYPTLTKGLKNLAMVKPQNPTEWLGKWLLENNPNKPQIVEPADETATQ